MRSKHALPELLFFGGNIYDALEQRKAAVQQGIASLGREELASGIVDEIVAKVIGRYSLNVPILHEDQKHADREEVKLDVSQDQRRSIFDRSRPLEVDAMRITIWVPFDGDPEFFRLQPSTFTFNPPRGEVVGHEVGFVFVDTNPTSQRINAEFDSWLASVKQYLSWHQQGMAKFNADLQGVARQAITARQQKLAATADLLAGLNIPVKERLAEPAATISSRPALKKTSPLEERQHVDQYDCFVSYASEDRAIVVALVDALQRMKISIWWDQGQIQLGDRLSQKIDEGLRLSRYGLVIVSDFFVAKHWTEAELRALAHRAINSGHKVILPVLVGMDHGRFASIYPLLADIVSTTYRGDPEALATEVAQAISLK
ncbi:MAG: toll/interleukin-1 receptor domain-containing protein [Candidatus Binataceae bacterium]